MKRFLLLGAIALTALMPSARAQGTAFTYQGRLTDGASPANGSYDLRFALHDAPSGGAPITPAITNSATPVVDGLFIVMLDFGSAFPGANRWLDIGVRSNGTSDPFIPVTPRQPLTATPYAITAGEVTSRYCIGSSSEWLARRNRYKR